MLFPLHHGVRTEIFKLQNSGKLHTTILFPWELGAGAVQGEPEAHFWRCVWKSHVVAFDTSENRTDYEM